MKISARSAVKGLDDYICKDFIGFPGTMQDVYRADIFLKEFHAFEEKGDLPNFVVMLLPNDHTAGTRPTMPTPRAAVADNDLAVGRIVEAISLRLRSQRGHLRAQLGLVQHQQQLPGLHRIAALHQ